MIYKYVKVTKVMPCSVFGAGFSRGKRGTRMNIYTCAWVTSLALLFGGCKTFSVSKDNGAGDSSDSLKGIPFVSKVPDRVRTTTWVRTEAYAVSGEMRITAADGKEETKKIFDPPILIKANTVSRKEILDLQKPSNEQDPDNFEKNFLQKVMEIATNAEGKNSSSVSIPDVMKSNTEGIEMVIDPTRYYFQIEKPLIGSVTASFKLAPDGTLSEGSSSVTDDTAKTLLSMVPFGSLTEKLFDLESPVAPPKNQKQTIQGIEVQDEQVKKRTLKTFTLIVTEQSVVYQVKARCRYGLSDQQCGLPPMVSIDEGEKGSPTNTSSKYTVELISASNNETDANKDDDSGYRFSGKVTVPKTK